MRKLILGLLLATALSVSGQTYSYSHGTIYNLNRKVLDTAKEFDRSTAIEDSSTFTDDVKFIVDTIKHTISIKTPIKTTTFKIVNKEYPDENGTIIIEAIKSDDDGNIAYAEFFINPEEGLGGMYYDGKTFMIMIK